MPLLSAMVVVSTAFAGISIYAQTDDSELTTFEEALTEKALKTMNATSNDNATDDGSTSIADVSSLFDGLVVCNLGTAEVSDETQVASLDNSTMTTPTVSVTVMSETEVVELAANETETAAETSAASTNCVLLGEDAATSGHATDTANPTSTASSDATAGNATSTMSNMTGADNATSTSDASNATLTASSSDATPQY